MKGNSRVVEKVTVLRWALNSLVRLMTMKKEVVVRCGVEVWEQELARSINALVEEVNAALEKEGRIGLKLTGRIEFTEWENTEEKDEIPQPVFRD